jgi:hypothetical protein
LNQEATIIATYPSAITLRAFFILVPLLEANMALLSTQDPDVVYNDNSSFPNTDNTYLLPNE